MPYKSLVGKYFSISGVQQEGNEVTFYLTLYVPGGIEKGRDVASVLSVKGEVDVTLQFQLPSPIDLITSQGIKVKREKLMTLPEAFVSSLRDAWESNKRYIIGRWRDIFVSTFAVEEKEFDDIGKVKILEGKPQLSDLKITNINIGGNGEITVSITCDLWCEVTVEWWSQGEFGYKEVFDIHERLWRQLFTGEEGYLKFIEDSFKIKEETWKEAFGAGFSAALQNALMTLKGFVDASRLNELRSLADTWVSQNLRLIGVQMGDITYKPSRTFGGEVRYDSDYGVLAPTYTMKTTLQIFEEIERKILNGEWDAALNFIDAGVMSGLIQIVKDKYTLSSVKELYHDFLDNVRYIKRETGQGTVSR